MNTECEEPAGTAPSYAMAASAMAAVGAEGALTLALAEMRRELRWMIEAGAGADLHTPPLPGRMDRDEMRMANECLIAIRACRDVLGTMPDDDHPAWLSEVIDGKLEL